MAKVYRIRTKLSPRAFVNKLVRDISAVSPRYIANEVLTENMVDFEKKSQWGSDRTGTKWKPLSPFTIRKKQNALRRQSFKKKRVAKQHSRMVSQFTKQGKEQGLTHNQALSAAVSAANHRMGFDVQVPINIESERMRLAMRPGRISGRRYSPPSEQTVQQTKSFLRVSISVPYARYTSEGTQTVPSRPIMMPMEQQVRWGKRGVVNSLDAIIGAF